jgi:FeS assembly protein IscX
MLTWEDSYAIAQTLASRHLDVNPEEVSLEMIYCWALGLSEFKDDPELANEAILTAILNEWFEEVNPV